MNNRIMAMLFALVAAMFISIVPVKAEAAEAPECKHEHALSKCGYVVCVCESEKAHNKAVTNNTCSGTYKVGAPCKWTAQNGKCYDPNGDCVCNICGGAYHVPELVNAKKATCTENGQKKHYECANNCGNWFADAEGKTPVTSTDVIIVSEGHKKDWEITKTTHKKVCTVCGEVFHGLQEHTFAKGTDNGDGKHTKKCTVCEYEVTEKHDDGDTKNCSCASCDAALEHVSETWVQGDAGHSHKCDNCGEVYGFEKHTFGEFVRNEGTRTHSEVCSVCGKSNAATSCKATKDPCYCDDCEGLMPHGFEDKDVMRSSATCTEVGYKAHYVHEKCGNVFEKVNGEFVLSSMEKVTIPAKGHALNATWEETADGAEHYQWCANNCGTKLYPNGESVAEGTEAHSHKEWYKTETAHCEICAVCGLSYGDEKHEYTEVELAAASSTGTQRHKLVCECGASVLKKCSFDENCVCKVCGAEKVHDIAALSTVPGAKDPTCTVAGVKTHYKCNTCNGIFFYEGGKCTKITAADTVIPALGHKWVAKGTDVADGKHVMKCDNSGCNKYTTKPHYTEDGDCYCDVAGCKEIAHSHKHVYVAAVPATCTAEGTEAYYYYQDCGKKFDLNEKEITAPAKIPAKGHDFGEEWIPCEDGIHAKFCANCDEFISEAHTFKNGNVQCATCGGEETLTHVEAKAATCTESGNVEYWTSLVTGKKYADAAGTKLLTNVTVAATGHAMSGSEDLANGLGHQKVCMNDGCDYTLTENHDNANGCFCTDCGGFKTGHENELVEAVPATCAKEGTQAHFKCSCGKLYDLGFNAIEKVGTIAKLKHEMNTTVKKDAKQGKHYIECKNCDYKMYEEHAMEMSDPHKGNYHQWLCSCGELKIETHYDKNGDKKCDVCGHSTSGTSATTTVEQHDNKTVYTGDSSKIQTTKSWWQNWLDTLTPSYSGGSNSTASTEANTPAVNESATQNQTSNQGQTAAAPSTGSNTNTTTTTTNTPANSTVSAEQTNVIAQFVTWILGLFGF